MEVAVYNTDLNSDATFLKNLRGCLKTYNCMFINVGFYKTN